MKRIKTREVPNSKPSDHEFWKGQFDLGGNLPGTWFHSAFDLLTAADVLDRFRGDLLGETIESMSSRNQSRPTRLYWERMSANKVSHMLRAMATECLLKALWLQYGEKLAENGRYVGVMKKNEHQLHELAKAVATKGSIVFTKREIELLEQASYWIVSGRYPIQKESSYLVPIKRADGAVAPKQFWKGDPEQELKELIAKLQAAVGITMQFES